ncbi:uncharacterized protein LOC133308367 [Gastrolobium bilobum]|uniref:uncharacterized protein LOC133308367 n=1 Tax=Gastrolobium bilobum TaxID=150636 RepID=UPI002AAF1C4C|nr:uncharacterized protein LOC133308367 [Gastrolobium bilobum]
MLHLRLFRLCSIHARSNQAPILQETYKGYKATGFRSLSTDSVKMDSKQILENESPVSYQNVIVMRHGDRMDNFEPLWASTAARPWDPPLAQAGRIRAFQTGRRLRQSLGFPIHRVFVSPFLRCVQTAAGVVVALSAIDDGPGTATGDGVPIDASKVKVSVEYGLCEMMNREAIRLDVAPKDGNWGFDISEREAMLPAGTVDNNVARVYKELPLWEEPVLQTRARYQQIIKDLADKYPNENLLLVTHGEGVGVALSSFKKNAAVNEVQYCAYVELRRPIVKKEDSVTAGEFDVLTQSGQTGVIYFLPRPLSNDINQTSS